VPEIRAHYQSMHQQIAEAEKILIVGGGPLGVELAGEVKRAYPDKTVSICHTGVSPLQCTLHAVRLE
jgi:apoptosis-inducing factor 2